MQNWTRLYSYIHDYQNLLYSYYSKHAVAFLTTYYNLNTDVTIWDADEAYAGSYERVGELTGMKWDKYLLLPVYFIDEISTAFDAQDIGQNKMQETTITFPSTYGITPLAGDVIKLEQQFMNPDNNTYPVFMIEGVEIHPNTERRFWKLKLKVFESVDTVIMDNQTEDTFVFFDYDKKIHTLDDAIVLAQLMEQDDELSDRLKNMWNTNTGFYSV